MDGEVESFELKSCLFHPTVGWIRTFNDLSFKKGVVFTLHVVIIHLLIDSASSLLIMNLIS
jgi:hypothetical protein